MADNNASTKTPPPAEDNPAPLSQGNQLTSSPDTENALDQLLTQVTATPPPADDVGKSGNEPKPTSEEQKPSGETKPTGEEQKPAGEAKPTGEEQKPAGETKPTDEKKTASFVDELLKPTGEKKEAPKTEEDPFDNIKLRSDASPKTRETFDQLKKEARERVEKERAERERIQREYEEFKQKAPADGKLPEDVEKELKELREFRATFDIERDPQFQQKFDTRKTQNFESVYGVLRQFELPESEVEVLKKMSEVERIEAISKLAAKLPTAHRLKIESKFVENAGIDDERSRAVAEARTKADQILKEKAEAPVKEKEQFYTEVTNYAKQLATSAEIFNVVEIPADTPPAEKARMEKRNAAATKLQQLYVQVLSDESPKAKVESAYGLVLAHNYREQLVEANNRVAELEKEIASIKKAGRVGDKGSTPPRNAAPKPPAPFSGTTSESLDALYRQEIGG